MTFEAAWAGWILLGFGSVVLAGGAVAMPAGWRRFRPVRGFPKRLVGILLAAATAGLLAVLLRLVTGPGGGPDRLWALGAFVLLPAAVALYPDDRPPTSLGWTSVAIVACAGGIGVAYPDLYVKTGLAGMVAYLLLLAVQWWRYEHTDSAGRRAVLWLALGTVPGPMLAAIIGFAGSGVTAAVAFGFAWVVFIACLGIGLVAPDLRDVRGLAVTVVVHFVAGLLVITVFATVLSIMELSAGRAVRPSPGALGLIAAACAAGYAPATRWLRVLIEVLLFGTRSDPLRSASRVGQRLSDDPIPALRSLRESLALPYAALVDGSGRVVAASGRPPESVARHALSATDDTLGHLEVGLRAGQQALHRGDQQVLAVLAPALAQLMHARTLRAQLQTSRAAVVTAVEEERRRLRRDLHDGLGPRLTGLAYAADAARNVLGRDPARAADLLTGLRAEAGEAIGEVRRLVEGLRPPSLDQVGLEQALRQQARHVLNAAGRPMAVDLTVTTPLPALGAAVEVTAYRIAVEALTNAARHSGGDRVDIALCVDRGALAIEVRDNGHQPSSWSPGVGLTSMRERVEMLGGTVITTTDTAGGLVSARLPLAAQPHQ
ncbi:MAG: two-component system, NarL family, sensor kinase [Micromonosporaceae bacterium]|jgi:signal transduction histidine kinase|nr:two-component system, NarL family, sensor kinase [Micromonosporaceae bacterium]